MTTTALTRKVPTWKMTAEELARVWAAHNGVTARTGGWLYDSKGRAIGQGWAVLTRHLLDREVIVVGIGIDWRRSDRLDTRHLIAGARYAAAAGRERARTR